MTRVSPVQLPCAKTGANANRLVRVDPMLASTMSFEMVQNKREEGYELYGENSGSQNLVRVRAFSL